ncbi:uncharacterized protein LOC114964559 [Acropora millepora]|uniref:uncharacterized protein LOC114964559 n=1 Tax=Acropora millepora TaxID=45264 RepID=UPI001CF20EF6|nr:uncharacterized protein LOC114964559 [Acropora millepora]
MGNCLRKSKRKPKHLRWQPLAAAVHDTDLDATARKSKRKPEHLRWQPPAAAVRDTDLDAAARKSKRKPEHLPRQLPLAAVHVTDLEAAARKSHTSEEYAKAVKKANTSDEHPLHKFYKIQSLQYLGEETDRESVPIWIAGYDNSSSDFEDVASSWIEHIQRAISDINEAVPGLNLHTVSEESKAIIKMAGNRKKSCYTMGRILSSGSAKIYLYPGWNNKKRTSCHELLHALGFGHEHQRPDRDYSIEVGSDTSQYKKLDDLYGVTRFDPYSIMLYPEDEEYLRRSGDAVWFTKPSHELNVKMSELDKMGVNNLYRPCKRTGYSPVIGSTGLFYCGRYIGVQSPGHNGFCGPNDGVNCPACRALKTDRVVSLWEKDKWQGWTGAIYCGSYFGVQCVWHDGYCGPDNGPQCPECYKELTQ